MEVLIKYWVITRKDKNHIDWLFHFLESDVDLLYKGKYKAEVIKIDLDNREVEVAFFENVPTLEDIEKSDYNQWGTWLLKDFDKFVENLEENFGEPDYIVS